MLGDGGLGEGHDVDRADAHPRRGIGREEGIRRNGVAPSRRRPNFTTFHEIIGIGDKPVTRDPAEAPRGGRLRVSGAPVEDGLTRSGEGFRQGGRAAIMGA
ncbi:hypothetical protein GCM10010486_78930 [Nonomuraea roseoviolacea subsp. carminata]